MMKDWWSTGHHAVSPPTRSPCSGTLRNGPKTTGDEETQCRGRRPGGWKRKPAGIQLILQFYLSPPIPSPPKNNEVGIMKEKDQREAGESFKVLAIALGIDPEPGGGGARAITGQRPGSD